MPRLKCIRAALLFFVLAGLKPVIAQSPAPEFFITVTPSVVTVLQGEATSLTVAITCHTSSLVVAADCNACVYDPAAKQLVWTGSASKTIDNSNDPQKIQKNLNKAMQKLLKNFPPGRNKSEQK